MKWKLIYEDLISKRKLKPATGYIERHHILPRCMGGTDKKDNLVVLTGREHWVAHLLLYKIHGTGDLVHACHMMAMRCEERGIPRIKNSRMYEAVRKAHAELTRLRNSQNTGSKNSQYGTRWICSRELKQNRKIAKTEPIPNGWEAGRSPWVQSKGRTNKKCCVCGVCTGSPTRKFCDAHRHKSNAARKGIKLSDETKRRMSEAKKKLYKDPTKNPAYGRSFRHSEESRKKISQGLKRRKQLKSV